MNKKQRIKNILVGIIMMACAVIMVNEPLLGVAIIVLILCCSFIVGGLSDVIYYISMARHMVGGKVVLYKGIIMLDLGIFALTLSKLPRVCVMIYLILALFFAGAIDVLRALESRKLEARSWKLNLGHGILNIAMAIVCIICISSAEILVYAYSIGLVSSAVIRIIQACRRTAVVYIQ